MQLTDLLRRTPQLSGLTPGDLSALAAAFVVSDFPAGHAFIREGEKGNTIFVVVEGEVRVTRRQGLRKRELKRMKPGDLFGLIALVDEAPRFATCKALGAVKVGSLSHAAISLLFNQAAPIASAFQLALAAQLARDFRDVNQFLVKILTAQTGP